MVYTPSPGGMYHGQRNSAGSSRQPLSMISNQPPRPVMAATGNLASRTFATGPQNPPIQSAAHQSTLPPQSQGNGAPVQRPAPPPAIRNEPWRDWTELTIFLSKLPREWGTWEVYKIFAERNLSPIRVEVGPGGDRPHGPRGSNHAPGTALVRFAPPPLNAPWVFNGLDVWIGDEMRHIWCRHKHQPLKGTFRNADEQRRCTDQVSVPGHAIEFGVMKDEDQMLVMRRQEATEEAPNKLVADKQRQMLEMHFSVEVNMPEGGTSTSQFKFKVPFTEMRGIIENRNVEDQVSFVISLESPPMAFRKRNSIASTHDPAADTWDERQAWYRQVFISKNPAVSQEGRKTKLRNEDVHIDVGRWTVYRFVLPSSAIPAKIHELRRTLISHNIPIIHRIIYSEQNLQRSLWFWLEYVQNAPGPTASFSLLSNMDKTLQLPFRVHYQLEVCISQGYLHESNIGEGFVLRLRDMQEARAMKLLEKVAENKRRYFKPMDVFQLLGQIHLATKQPPRYCTMIRSATVTPTKIVLNSPSLDTSNRVIRKYIEYEDRFLRVKFRDESYKGTIIPFDDDTTIELFTRVKHTMRNGIVVGDRHYEFLAFGNSQFREHGAYFFAPTADLTADDIRQWMGNFSDIQVVAKYASRIGQCFSTTRAMRNNVTVVKIEDTERNGHCFTDGVGKISQALAQMTAEQMGVVGSAEDCPSVYQFRMGGCKGVLAVDPNLKGGLKVEIRPSQEKFPTTSTGLEICRISQFATSYLNQQIVLVLSALGVPDHVFLTMLRNMLSNLELAMTDETTALDLLQRNVDLCQTTVTIAEVVLHGFMAAEDPFTLSLLRLWRSWSIKYLKEKAKIFVEQGAFVLGVVDETGTLKGYTREMPVSDMNIHDPASLPEIFLQIPDPKRKGKFNVLEGVCTIARNPSLHPGDVRVVLAVNNPSLRHLRNCLVLPQTGDRDLASMCSGGDLDGDDYLVMWDLDLLPTEWNHAPMDYTAPPPLTANGPVTVDDMTTFFVRHMRNDNLPRIAVAHRYWADRLEDGVKSDKCIQLAALHSQAVDYAKSGVPADFPKDLKVTRWPHWCEKKFESRIYRSNRILGQLFDEVDRVPFVPAWDAPFDQRVLGAFNLGRQILEAAAEVKLLYDEAMRRIMAQHGVISEFEVWSTFVLEHNHESRDYKIAEELGTTVEALKGQFRELCYERAGTTFEVRDPAKLEPWVVAMYTVTAREVRAANDECAERKLVAGQWVPRRMQEDATMPLISFPWMFHRELCHIAVRRNPKSGPISVAGTSFASSSTGGKKKDGKIRDAKGEEVVVKELEDVDTVRRDSVGVVKELSKEGKRRVVDFAEVQGLSKAEGKRRVVDAEKDVTPVEGQHNSHFDESHDLLGAEFTSSSSGPAFSASERSRTISECSLLDSPLDDNLAPFVRQHAAESAILNHDGAVAELLDPRPDENQAPPSRRDPVETRAPSYEGAVADLLDLSLSEDEEVVEVEVEVKGGGGVAFDRLDVLMGL